MFSTNYQDVNDIIPAGVYEAMITSASEDGKITLKLEIRKDVEQDCKGRGFSHWMYKLREPSDIDKQIGGYSYAHVMRIAKSAHLPEGKSYASLGEMLKDLIGCPVRVELYHDEYNGNKYLKVKYWNETQAGAPTYKPTQPTAAAAPTSAPAQAAAAADQKLPWEL